MSTLDEKLAPPAPTRTGGARATLSEIYKMWGDPKVTKSDEKGAPTEVTREDLEGRQEVWERKTYGKEGEFEKKVEG